MDVDIVYRQPVLRGEGVEGTSPTTMTTPLPHFLPSPLILVLQVHKFSGL